MKKYIIILCVLFSLPLMGQDQNLDSEITPERIEALNRNKNRADKHQFMLKQKLGSLEVYAVILKRGWPKSWNEVEKYLSLGIWDSPEDKKKWVKTFALISEISGHLINRRGAKLEGELVVITTSPVEFEISHGKKEIGRWVVWEVSEGQYAIEWHLEEEIKLFSAWAEVQVEIDKHLKEVAEMFPEPQKLDKAKMAAESQSQPDTQDSEPTFATKPPVRVKKIAKPEPLKVEPVSENPFPYWVFIIGGVVIVGLVVVLRRK